MTRSTGRQFDRKPSTGCPLGDPSDPIRPVGQRRAVRGDRLVRRTPFGVGGRVLGLGSAHAGFCRSSATPRIVGAWHRGRSCRSSRSAGSVPVPARGAHVAWRTARDCGDARASAAGLLERSPGRVNDCADAGLSCRSRASSRGQQRSAEANSVHRSSVVSPAQRVFVLVTGSRRSCFASRGSWVRFPSSSPSSTWGNAARLSCPTYRRVSHVSLASAPVRCGRVRSAWSGPCPETLVSATPYQQRRWSPGKGVLAAGVGSRDEGRGRSRGASC